MKSKTPRTGTKGESSSEYFRKLRPSFLDWTPQTEEEKLREAKARKDAKDAQLRKVTELEKVRQAEKKSAAKKSSRGKAGGKR